MGFCACLPALPHHELAPAWDGHVLSQQQGEPAHLQTGRTDKPPPGRAPSERAVKPARQKVLQFPDATRQGGIKAPSICEDSSSRVISEQLHLLPFRRATTLPAAGTALLEENTARGCRAPAPLPRRRTQPGTVHRLWPPRDGTRGQTPPLLPRGKQWWDGRSHARLPPCVTDAAGDPVFLFGETGPTADTCRRTRSQRAPRKGPRWIPRTSLRAGL